MKLQSTLCAASECCSAGWPASCGHAARRGSIVLHHRVAQVTKQGVYQSARHSGAPRTGRPPDATHGPADTASDTGDIGGDLAQVRAAFARRCVTGALHPSCVGVPHTASDRRLGNSRPGFRYLATYFSRSADRDRRAMVATAGFLHGSDLLRLLLGPTAVRNASVA